MENSNCTGCGKVLHVGDWKSKSGLCRACAEAKHDANPRNRLIKNLWLILIIGIFSIIGIIWYIGSTTPDTPDSIIGADGNPTNAALIHFSVIAESAVKDNLKAPKTAEFDTSSEIWYVFDDGVYGISGTVTAENSFGVPLASEYIVKFKCWGFDSDEYEVLEVVIE